MTISTITDNRISYTGNGSTTNFSVTFPIFKKADGVTHYIEVIKYTIATGAEETLVENTGYTVVQSAGDPSTGTVTISPALSSAYKIYIISTLEPKQALDLVNGTAVNVPDIEKALDRLTMLHQLTEERLSRAVLLPKTTDVTDLEFPSFDGSVEGDIPTVNATQDGYVYKSVDELVSVAAFDISALTAESTVDTAADYAAMYDTSAGAMRKVLIEDLAPPSGDDTLHGNVQQVQKVTLTTPFTQTCVTAGEWQDITGLTVNITPSRKNSKLLIGGWVSYQGTGGGLRVVAGNNPAVTPSSSFSNAEPATKFSSTSGSTGVTTFPFVTIVDANTTETIAVKVQKSMGAASNVTYFNRSATDTDAIQFSRPTSHLFVMEILQNTEVNTATKYSNITSLQNNTYSSQSTTSWALANRLLKGSLQVVPTANPSTTILLGNINSSVVSTSTQHNITKNDALLFSASSPGSRRSVTFRMENGVCAAATILGIESISSLTPAFYQVISGFNATTTHTWSNTTPALNTDSEGASVLYGLNFNTETGSTWKGVSTTTLTTTESSSTLSGGRFTTSLTASITPGSASEKLLVLVNICMNKNSTAGAGMGITLSRDGTNLVGTSASSRMASTASINVPASATDLQTMTLLYLVDAGSTSSTTFTVLLDNADTATQTIYVNRSGTDTDNNTFARGVSQISVIRILPNA